MCVSLIMGKIKNVMRATSAPPKPNTLRKLSSFLFLPCFFKVTDKVVIMEETIGGFHSLSFCSVLSLLADCRWNIEHPAKILLFLRRLLFQITWDSLKVLEEWFYFKFSFLCCVSNHMLPPGCELQTIWLFIIKSAT